MAKIVAVHGTFVNGLEKGNFGGDWWQIGGELEKDIKRFVSTKSGAVEFVPFGWSGKNSEAERHAAGVLLLETIMTIEKAGEAYCLIGHSHGGSVVSHALLEAAHSQNAPLKHLSRWVTIGTPFIHNRKHPLLFQRLRTLGQAAYAIVMFYVLIFLLNGAATTTNTIALHEPLSATNYIIFGAVLIGAAYCLFYLLARFQPPKLRHLEDRVTQRARLNFSDKWLPVVHEDDEAVQSLKKATNLRFSPISKTFAVEQIAGLSIFVLPVFLALLIFTKFGQDAVPNLTYWATGELYFPPKGGLQRAADTALRLTTLPAHAFLHFFNPPIGSLPAKIASTGLSMIAAVSAMYALSVLIFATMRIIAIWISSGLSTILNAATVAGIKQSAWGGDAIGEGVVASSDAPQWVARVPQRLPEDLSREITEESNKSAAIAIANIRRAMKELTFLEDGSNNIEQIAEKLNLTARELIHTTYFSVPRVRKLLALVVAKSDGFQVNEGFRSDVDYGTINAFYEFLRNMKAPKP